MVNNGLKENDIIRIIWDYFSLHSSQRMQMMSFYILLETFFITLLGALYKMKVDIIHFHIILSIAIIFFSFIFYSLDKRTKDMIKYAEKAIKIIENKYTGLYGEEVMIFTTEDKQTIKERESKLIGLIDLILTTIKIF